MSIELLEQRVLFVIVSNPPRPAPPLPSEVTLMSDGTLIVRGNPGNDLLEVSRVVYVTGTQEIHVGPGITFVATEKFPAASIKRVLIEGGDGDDFLRVNDSLNLPATLMGGDGRDKLFGGQGDEWLIGEAGSDVIYAYAGDDVIHAGAGNDSVYGHEGNDTMLGLDGNDVLYGGWGQDHLDGGRSDDHLLGEDSNDFLEGGPDNDILDGGAGTDTLYAGDGNDYLMGGRGVGDSMRGGMGNDKFRADDILGNGDSMWGEAGFDVLVSAADADDLFVRGPQTR